MTIRVIIVFFVHTSALIIVHNGGKRRTKRKHEEEEPEDTEIVYSTQHAQYTRTQLRALDEANFDLISTRQRNCKFYVDKKYAKDIFGTSPKTTTVLFICYIYIHEIETQYI